MTPKISVVLPVHNRADVLARAIRSVLDQRVQDWELIIVDDGSTDGSVMAARSFGDPRVKIIELGQNRGGNAARNAGVREAQAPLVAFLDSDDTYLPAKLETVLVEFDRHPELELLVDSFFKMQPSGARVTRKNPVINDRETFRKALFTRQLWKATPSITVKRDTALRVMFDETLRRLQDFDFLIRATEVANCASTDAVLWVKYWDPNAISIQDNIIAANVELVRRHPEYLSVREYRPGLAYILRLSLWRRLKEANLAGAARDVRQLATAFGRSEAARLLFEAGFPRRFV
ncbi:MAG: glycosyltransferase family 2 protein [Sphingomicrobium sp.]